ncbi:hypothetical protein ACFO0N_14930 [Halobium salinum]|uniref:Uncharacterized protein n=1 Tax=Halobium salinum TaxID=1364940 RepID=A0ABD5PET8_9EURY|nr:hypothetical protein [Halobium salinum]
MTSDELEIRLKSVNKHVDWDDSVDLHIQAVLSENSTFAKNTFFFDCDPVGTNCRRSYLEVVLPDREVIDDIHEFLSNHLIKDDEIRRSIEIPLVEGKKANS